MADNRIWFHNSRYSLSNDMTVWGRGVNASVVESDIGTVNGVVHIIDRVLGVPYMTIGEYMESDPDMRYKLVLIQIFDVLKQVLIVMLETCYFISVICGL